MHASEHAGRQAGKQAGMQEFGFEDMQECRDAIIQGCREASMRDSKFEDMLAN